MSWALGGIPEHYNVGRGAVHRRVAGSTKMQFWVLSQTYLLEGVSWGAYMAMVPTLGFDGTRPKGRGRSGLAGTVPVEGLTVGMLKSQGCEL